MSKMSRRWERGSRYYTVWIQLDLFGDCVVIQSWGSKGTKQGGMKTTVVANETEALALIETIAKRREQHHYTEISTENVLKL